MKKIVLLLSLFTLTISASVSYAASAGSTCPDFKYPIKQRAERLTLKTPLSLISYEYLPGTSNSYCYGMDQDMTNDECMAYQANAYSYRLCWVYLTSNNSRQTISAGTSFEVQSESNCGEYGDTYVQRSMVSGLSTNYDIHAVATADPKLTLDIQCSSLNTSLTAQIADGFRAIRGIPVMKDEDVSRTISPLFTIQHGN